jgi:DNA-3-methyladenine glycosylase II
MLQNLQNLIALEPKFQLIIDTYGVPSIPFRNPGLQSLVHLILEQQVSIASAQATMDKLLAYITVFSANELQNISVEQYKTIGVSRQKANYIINLSHKILNKEIDLDSWLQKPEEIVYQELIALKGIGDWTAQVYLLFCLQKENIFPVGDIAIQHTMREFFNHHATQEMQVYANNWSPYKSLATHLLWHWYLRKRNR